MNLDSRLGLVASSILTLALLGCVRKYDADLELGRTGAQTYSAETSGTGIVASNPAVAKRLLRAARGVAGAALREDGRMAALAQWVGGRLGPSGLLPDRAEIDFFTRHLGLVEPTPLVFLVPQAELNDVERGVADGIRTAKEVLNPTHIGMVLARAYGLSYWVVVVAERRLALSPLPRSVELNAEVRVSGTLPAGLREPRVRVRTSRGETADLAVGAGPQFDARLPTERAVVLQVEISGVGEQGRKTLATMPVYVAQQPPVDTRHAPVAVGMDVEAAKRAVVSAIQEERKRAGLNELRVDPALSTEAGRHTEEMSVRGTVTHEGQNGSKPPDRVRAAGFETGLVFENVGRGRDVLLLHDDFMSNPGQRAPVLNPEVTHLGVGVARTKNVGGDVYYLTEVFVGEQLAVDLAAAPEQIVEQINKARSDRGEGALAMDEALSAIAQDALNSYLSDPFPVQQAVLDQANAELADFSMSYKRTAAAMVLVRSSGGVALDPTLEEGATHVGVAIAKAAGKRRELHPADLAVVLTLGWARTD